MVVWLVSVGPLAFAMAFVLVGIFHLIRQERRTRAVVRRGNRRLAELGRLTRLETLQLRKEMERNQVASERRWADHEVLMRMILERFDGPGRSGDSTA